MEVDQQCNAEYAPMQGVLSEVASFCQPYVQKLYDSDKATILEGLKQIKNFVIGNNKQKSNFIIFGVIQRLLCLIEQPESDTSLKVHCAVILGSLAKGIDTDITNLLDCGVLKVMYDCLRHSDLKLYEACIRCVRTIVLLPENQELMFYDPSIIPVLLESINRSMCVQECTCEIITYCCKTKEHQHLFRDLNAVPCLVGLLKSDVTRVKVKALKAISVLGHKNKSVCLSFINAKIGDSNFIDALSSMLSRGEPIDIQINAAKCLTYIRRCEALELDKDLVYKKVLPCLVRMCDPSRNVDDRVTGAAAVAYLIESEPELQRIALICEQFPQTLETYFAHPSPADTNNAADMRRFNYELSKSSSMHEAVFLAYAALLANDEDMRDLVVNETLVDRVVRELEHSSEPLVRVAALRCLLSLSRSVRILRTFFEDLNVWKVVLTVLQRAECKDGLALDEEQIVGSALLCNLLLDFSPCRWKLIDSKALEMLKGWCLSDDSINLKRNGIWGFFNVTFQAIIDLKLKVMELLDPDTLFMLLTTPDNEVVAKTLGVLHNVLASCDQVDNVMAAHGDTIMQACAVALESTSSMAQERSAFGNVQTRALCVLSCVAAGDENKTIQKHLHDNENFLSKLVEFLSSTDDELRRVAVDCVWKLSRGSAALVLERRSKLQELGVVDKLVKVNESPGSIPAEKIKETLAFLQP